MASLPYGINTVVVPPPKDIPIGWVERLTSWPWRPFKKTRTETHPMWGSLNGGSVLVVDGTVYMSTEMFHQFTRETALMETFDRLHPNLVRYPEGSPSKIFGYTPKEPKL